LALIGQRATMRGFVYFDYESQFATAEQRLWDWHRSGALRQRVDIVDGIEHALQAITRVFEGRNTGKQLLRLHTETGRKT
ncbi:NADP-dependent oxidoreductase, partial [Pseudomonas sp. MPR-AND1B]